MMNGEKTSLMAASLIEEQLRALPISIAAIETVDLHGGAPVKFTLRRKGHAAITGSAGNIVADKAEHPDKSPATVFELAATHAHPDPLRVTVSNALLAVGAFMGKHEMLSMRTPEIQFLSRVIDAMLNGNRLNLPPDYMPTAAFDGLVIEPEMDGKPLFDEGQNDGLMDLGDGLALLQWLSRYLRGERSFVTGGDAG